MKFIYVAFLLCVSVTQGLSPRKDNVLSTCPMPSQISPCTCYHIINDVRMTCRGSEITQNSIANSIQAVRGGIDENDWFEWTGWLTITNTSLASIDLSPFIQTYIERIQIENNPNLISIYGSLPPSSGKIGSKGLEIQNNPNLNDEGISQVLDYFNDRLEEVNLNHNNIEGYYNDGPELIKGLNSHSGNLVKLILWGNKIHRLKSGSFRNMTKIDTVELIDEIVENTFELHENHTSRYYSIMLNGNNITNERLHENIGVGNLNVRGYFYFHRNQFETFSRETFEPILSRNYNTIQFWDNPIICDERVKWLKDNRDKFGLYFIGANCVNDPGKTVFTSTLIP